MANCDARADRQCALGKAHSWMSKWHQYCHPQGSHGAGRRFGAATISPDGGGAGTPIRRSVRPQRRTPASTDNATVSLDELGRAMAAAGVTLKNGRLQPKDPQKCWRPARLRDHLLSCIRQLRSWAARFVASAQDRGDVLAFGLFLTAMRTLE